jgi:multidrug efflux pump subunit AcrA (membrane-fusion protein)
MDTKKKRMIYIGAAILAAVLILWFFLRETPVSVETGVSKRGPMVVTVNGEGKTRVRDKHTITAPVAGKMSRIKLTEGDNIPHDYPITEIDPNPPLQRSPDVYDERPNLYAAKVFSPVGGKVLRIFEKSGRIVAAGTPLLEIGNPDDIEIVVDILSTDAVLIPPGAPIIIENQNTSEPIKARVRLIESQAITKVSALGVEEQRVNIIGDFLSKGVRFGDNFRVDVRIVVWESDSVLTIPSSALFRSGENWSVFVVTTGKARLRSVTIGHQSADEAEVLGGLAEGDRVILHPPNQLAEGTSVASQ